MYTEHGQGLFMFKVRQETFAGVWSWFRFGQAWLSLDLFQTCANSMKSGGVKEKAHRGVVIWFKKMHKP